MSVSRRDLLAERARLVEQAKTYHESASTREWTPEETAKVDEIVALIADHDARIAAIEAAMAEEVSGEEMPAEAPAADPAAQQQAARARLSDVLSASSRRTRPAPVGVPMFTRDLDDKRANRDRETALCGWFLGNDARPEHRSAAQRSGLNLGSNRIVLTRANSTTSSAGGYTIPQGFLAELEKKIVYFNPLRDVARVIRTESGNSLPFPTIDDTGNPGAIGAENTAPSATDMTFGQIILGAYRTESLVLLSNELLRDSGLDLATEVAGLLGERLGRKEATDHATGNGTTAPQGVVTGSSAGVAGATTTTITLANIMACRNALDFGYQQNGAWMMHQSIWSTILQLADSQSRPLFLDLLNGNAPRLLGYPVIVNNAMASSIAANAKTVLFGDFSKFYIRDAGDIEIIRMNERYADAYQTGFMAVRRSDSKVAQSAAIVRITQPAT
jgi:HK97 family phage major capsid protein